MRRTFAKTLLELMDKNRDIYLLTGDLGHGVLDDIKKKYEHSGRFINCGISEQLMIGMAAGMAAEGKIPVCYSISSFLLKRPFEFISINVDYDELPVKLVGTGKDKEYGLQGFTHWMEDQQEFIFNNFENIDFYQPQDKETLPEIVERFILDTNPAYLSLSRF